MTYEPEYPPESPPDYEPEYDELPPVAFEPPPEAYDYAEPPPLEYEEPPLEAYDYTEAFVTTYATAEAPTMDPPPTEPPDNWQWVDARFVGLEQRDGNGEVTGYEVGCVDLYADATSGDLGGSYLRVQEFGAAELDRAENLLSRLNDHVFEKEVSDVPDLAEKVAVKLAGDEGTEPPAWRALTPVEYALFEREFGLVEDAEPDIPPAYAHDDLLRTAYELGGVEVALDDPAYYPAAQALEEIGLSPDGFDPDTDPPPFYDAATNTAYWIGVYQPDSADPDVCVASILSLTRDPENGQYEAQLAPCVVGDWDKAYAASEHLIGVAERSADIERVFEAAEGMAIAGNQRDEWQHERGVELEPDSARDIGELAEQQWELDL